MAVLAHIGGLNVCRVLTGGVSAVVARDTVRRYIGVIEIRREPADRRVAVVAVLPAGDVRGVLAGCNDAVMTISAGAQNLCVIDTKRRYPDVWGVAVFTDVSRGNMRRILARSFDAIVTVDAVACDIGMVEIGRQPASG